MLLEAILIAIFLKKDTIFRISIPLLFILIGGVAGLLMVLGTLNPNKFRCNYTLRIAGGRLRLQRVAYGCDPEGKRYVPAGICALVSSLLWGIIAAAMLWPETFGNDSLIIAIVLLALPLAVLCTATERKLRRNSAE